MEKLRVSKYEYWDIHLIYYVLKMHMMDFHVDFFPANSDAVNDEKGEKIHQVLSLMEKRYHGNASRLLLET